MNGGGLLGCGGSSCATLIDSTATAGNDCGVHSVGAAAGDVLTSDGASGSVWAAGGGGGYSPSPITGVYNVAPVNIPALGSSTGSLVYQRGSAVLDLTTPTSPKAATRGVYFIGGSFQVDSVETAGFGVLALLFVNSSPQTNAYVSTVNQKDTIGGNGQVCLTVPLSAGANMSFTTTNRDSAARFVEWIEIVVTRILVY